MPAANTAFRRAQVIGPGADSSSGAANLAGTHG